MNKQAEITSFSLGKTLNLLLGVMIFLSIIVFPGKLYAYYTSNDESVQKDNMKNIGSEANELLLDLANSKMTEKEITIPFHIFEEYIVQGKPYNNVACTKDSSCICITSKVNPEKKIDCQNFKEAQLLTMGEIYSGKKDTTINMRIIAKKTDDKTTIELHPIEKTEEESNEDYQNSFTSMCSDKKPVNAEKSVEETLKTYGDIIGAAAKEYGIDEALIAGVLSQESNRDQYAVSECGAAGLMQLMPHTGDEMGIKTIYRLDEYLRQKAYNNENKISLPSCTKSYGEELKKLKDQKISENKQDELIKIDGRFDTKQNIYAAASYLKSLLARYEKHPDKNKLAVAAYNAGPGTIDKCCKDGLCQFNDECCSRLIPQTKEYVPQVLAYAEAAKTLG